MWVRYLSFAYKRDLARGTRVFIAAVSFVSLSGCACLVGNSSAATYQGGGRHFADPSIRQKKVVRHTTKKIVAPRPIVVPRRLLKKLHAPNCKVAGIQKPPGGSDAAGSEADPNLLKLAKLQLERDCYRQAEKLARKRLRQIQKSVD